MTAVVSYGRQLVRAMPGSTAHPSPEAWPTIGVEPDPVEFARLQERMAAAEAIARIGVKRRSVVVVPSRAVDRWHEPPAETWAYEERLLSFLLELRDPSLELTYVTSLPIARPTVDYYISMLPARLRLSARRRLRLVSLGDRSTYPLSAKLLARPSVLERIRRSIQKPPLSYLIPYNATGLERDVALALDIPMYGAAPAHRGLGTKSGSRELFARTGVPHPLGAERIRTIADASGAISGLRAAKPDLGQVVLKLDQGVAGEGNAVVDLTGLPQPGGALEQTLIERRVATLTPEAEGVSAADYLSKLADQGGVAEERITGVELRSPSVQLQIQPTGQVQVLSTHDQILGGPSGQRYLGCRFPAGPPYAPLIGSLAKQLGGHLADIGVIGRLAIDFVVARRSERRWEAFAIELNLRMGGTTHPYQTLVRLTDGVYDAASATFTTPAGQPKHYLSTDHLETPQLSALGREGVLASAQRGELLLDRADQVGVVLHMLPAIEELGSVGLTAIGNSADHAQALFDHARATLTGLSSARERQIGSERSRLSA
jgi:hypothetical protein